MVSFREFMIGFLLVGLFIFAMIQFSIGVARDNNANLTIQDDPRINASLPTLQEELIEAESTSQAEKDVFETDEPFAVGGSLLLTSIVGVKTIFTDTIVTIYNLTIGLLFNIFFGSTAASPFFVVFSVIAGILLITAILLAWRLIRTGE